jgi:hypothetical protein
MEAGACRKVSNMSVGVAWDSQAINVSTVSNEEHTVHVHTLRFADEALSVISGDPHVLSFDKRNLHPQGICKYQMAASEDATATFAVFSKFERRGTNMNVSYVKYTEVDVYEHNVRLDRHNIVYVSTSTPTLFCLSRVVPGGW